MSESTRLHFRIVTQLQICLPECLVKTVASFIQQQNITTHHDCGHDLDAVRSRIEALCPILDQIQDNTRSASISIGVLHHGEVIFTRSRGFRFTAACCGIPVDEGELNWTEPIRSYIPFTNTVDPVVGQRATSQDALSHNRGLAYMDLTWLGVECDSILDKKDLLEVISRLPPVNDLRIVFHYNNCMYAVAGLVIEQQSGRPWYEFLKERILEPLGMHRTVRHRKKLPHGNVAEPHVVIDGYSLHRQKPVDAAADDTFMELAGGVWSNQPSVLKQISTIVSHKSNITTSSIGENTYGVGFARSMIPSTDLRPRLVLYHNGGMLGYLRAFYLFPDTRSAIVALGNSHGLGDGPDWSVQAIT
ncbi:Inositol 2-dehydrogenase [Fusarium oxysporum f. sp. albedinis]|nr:Inositol 2-dehydrogenase [Fusarium oxysporum f. sp. albedinis]